MKTKIFYILVIIAVILLSSCKSVPPKIIYKTCDTTECRLPLNENTGNLGSNINSSSDDYAPVFMSNSNSLIFTSNRKGIGLGYTTEIKIGQWKHFCNENLWFSKLTNNSWSESKLFPVFYPNSQYNEGSIAFFPDGKNLLITTSYRFNGKGGSDIFKAQIEGNNIIIDSVNILNINSKFWDSHPAISPDGKTIVFASDRDSKISPFDFKEDRDTILSTDLYFSSLLSNGSWSEPEPIKKLNTELGNEITPFFANICGKTILFYSSNGLSGSKGYDLFFSEYDGLNWSDPKPIEAKYFYNSKIEINSKYDEIYPCVVVNGEQLILYFSSNRPGGCGGFDIYKTVATPFKFIVKGIISDSCPGMSRSVPINEDVKLKVIKLSDSTLYKEMTVKNSQYEFEIQPNTQYRIEVLADGYKGENVHNVYISGSDCKRELTCNFSLVPHWEVNITDKFPTFVTGYYRLNTVSNYIELQRKYFEWKKAKALFDVSYIHWDEAFDNLDNPKSVRFGKDKSYYSSQKTGKKYEKDSYYFLRAKDLDKKLKTSFVNLMEKDVLPKFKNCGVLKITINSYADEREIVKNKKYIEETISFKTSENKTVTIKKGSEMDNCLLSSLRAYYTMEHLKKLLSNNDSFKKMYSEGRIKFFLNGKCTSKGEKWEDIRRADIIIERE